MTGFAGMASQTTKPKSIKAKLGLMLLVALIGVGLSYVSLYQHTVIKTGAQLAPSFCNINATINCDKVNGSPYSQILGVPIAALGLWFYIMLAYFSLFSFNRALLSNKSVCEIFTLAGVLAVAFSTYLFVISHFVVGALCLLCLGMYLANVLVLVLARKIDQTRSMRSCIVDGLDSLVASPARLFRGKKTGGSFARTTLAFGMFILGGAIALPTFLYHSVIMPEYAASIGGQVELQLKEWKDTPAVELKLENGPALSTDYAVGDPKAPIALVEFSDIECPTCRALFPILEGLVSKYQGKIHFVYKNYPLDKSCNPLMERELHKSACYAAFFSRCAGEQGKFWEALRYLFTLSAFGSETRTDRVNQAIDAGVEPLGLDRAAIKECMISGRYRDKIMKDISQGGDLGLTGTPSVWVNSKRVKVPNELILERIFQDILGQKKSIPAANQ